MWHSKKVFMKLFFLVLFFLALYMTFFKLTGQVYAHNMHEGGPACIGPIDREVRAKTYTHEVKIAATEMTKPQTIEESLDLEQLEKVKLTATGYTAGYESTGKTVSHPAYGITSSGVKVRRDLYSTIAADAKYFPFGTILYIPGYGYGVVADRGGAIKGDKIDLYYDTVEEVFTEWGKQTLDVYIVKEGAGELTEAALNELNEDIAVQAFRAQFTTKN